MKSSEESAMEQEPATKRTRWKLNKKPADQNVTERILWEEENAESSLFFVQKVKEIKGMESQPGSWPMRNQLKEMSGIREAGQKRMEGRRGKLVRQFATSSSPSPPLLPSSTRWYLLSKIVTESTKITSIWMVEYKLSWLSEFNLWKSVHSMPPANLFLPRERNHGKNIISITLTMKIITWKSMTNWPTEAIKR